MDEVYHYTGMVFFWALMIALSLVIVYYIALFWKEYKFKLWIYQIYEYYSFKKRFNEFKINEWSLFAAKVHRNRLLGISSEKKYRKNHLFKKQLLKMFDEVIQIKQKEYDDYQPENVEQ